MNKAISKIYSAEELLYSTGTAEHVGELAPPVIDKVREAMKLLHEARKLNDELVAMIKAANS